MTAAPRSVSQNATPGSRIARRAVLGLGILAAATGGAASLLYGSIEPDADFSIDSDTKQRRALFAAVSAWDRRESIEVALAHAAARPSVMQVLAGAPLVQAKRSTVQKLVEELQSVSAGPSRLVLAAVAIVEGDMADDFHAARGALDALVSRGLDGVFLDCASAYAAARRKGPGMVDGLAAALAGLIATTRQVNPNFLVVIENAAELTASPALSRVIDGVARDDLLFGQDGIGITNKRTEVIAALHDLNRVKRSGRPVFVSERLPADAPATRAGAQQTLRSLGFIARFELPPQG